MQKKDMRIKNKINILNKQTIKFSKLIMLTLFLAPSIIFVGIKFSQADSVSLQPKTIWGYVTNNKDIVVVDASVIVTATGYPDKTDYTDSAGAYQVDIGHDTGTEWPTGTSFTVTVTKSGWKGSNIGTVAGTYTQCDVTLSKAKSIEYPTFYFFFERLFQRFPFFEKILKQ